VDARPGTPGALDDATGVATLLAAAELLRSRHGGPPVEIAVLNGEDYYGATGELAYLAANTGRWDEVALAVNVDGAGYREGATAVSFYGLEGERLSRLEAALAPFPGIVHGEPWVQGDHTMFVMSGVPAVAFTSEQVFYLATEITHTERDVPELVAPAKLAELAQALATLVQAEAPEARVLGSGA
jgi:aminopeptidase YwaD